MKLDRSHLNKSALSAVLFICVYHVFSLLIHGSFIVALMFLCATIFCARTLINEQSHSHKPFHNNYIYIIGGSWLALTALLFTVHNQATSIGIWFCILMLCTSILLRPAHSLRLNSIALIIFWLFAFLESEASFKYIEGALALTVILLLSGIIQTLILNLEAELNTAKETDNLTGCIQASAFKAELEKVAQLYDRYKTPFSLISIKYQSHFSTEADLQTWLKELSNLYQTRLRKTDVLCRFNTQKFMILLPSTNMKNAETLRQDLQNCVSAYEFSFNKESSIVHEPPSLTFMAESFEKNENFEDWFRQIQSQ